MDINKIKTYIKKDFCKYVAQKKKKGNSATFDDFFLFANHRENEMKFCMPYR